MTTEPKFTPGPLTVTHNDRRPYSIYILTADGKVAFSETLMCHSTVDKSWQDALECRNFPHEDRDKARAMNERQLANAYIRAAAPELYEAINVMHECGPPQAIVLYDEEGVDGWLWSHPDGREWDEIDWGDGSPPMHPVARAALAKARGEEQK